MSNFVESDVEEAALSYFEELGYTILHGPDIAPGEPNCGAHLRCAWEARREKAIL